MRQYLQHHVMPRLRDIILRLFIFLIFVYMPVMGQQSPPQVRQSSSATTRPKVGLVLSGGGARGLAHIGVLKWFEEHRIPVDYVAGTSMGGLIGAMYSMGMSPAEMEAFVKGLDWDKVLTGPPSHDELSFRRKEDRRAYPIKTELGVREGLLLPPGVNPGHHVGLVLDRLTLPFSTVRDFDQLPIPFACVATDMLKAERVVFRSGHLTQSLRATIAIPGVFTPAEIDGRVLADGGLLDNIPTDVAQDMGAERIIAVNVGTPLGTREDIQTLPGILAQVIGVTTIESDRRNLKLADVVITPNLGKYTIADFDEGEALIQLGYGAAEKQTVPLSDFSLDEVAWREHLAARRAKVRTLIPTPTDLEVAGVEGRKALEIKEEVRDEVKEPFQPNRLEPKLDEIRGGGRYESLGYDVVQLEKTNRLRIRVREKSYGPNLVTPVLLAHGQDSASLNLSAGFRLTNFDVWGYGTELRTDVIFGSNNLFAVEYFRPLGEAGFFVAPRVFYSSSRVDLYQGSNREAEYLARQGGAAIDLGYVFNRRTQLRAGYQISRLDARVDIGSSLLPDVKGQVSVASTQFGYDGQDSAVVPTRGVRIDSSLRWYLRAPGAQRGFPQAELGASFFTKADGQNLLFGFGGGGTTFDREAGPAQQFTLGGPFRLGAIGRGELRGDHFAYGGAGYLYRLRELQSVFVSSAYVGVWYEGGSAFSRKSDARYFYDGAGALIFDTPLGPLAFGGAWGVGGRGKMFFSFGRLF